MATPLMIEIAIHYGTRYPIAAELFGLRQDRHKAPAVVDATQAFVEMGLLRPVGETFAATEGLKFWLDAICSVPPPERVWRIRPTAFADRPASQEEGKVVRLHPNDRNTGVG